MVKRYPKYGGFKGIYVVSLDATVSRIENNLEIVGQSIDDEER